MTNNEEQWAAQAAQGGESRVSGPATPAGIHPEADELDLRQVLSLVMRRWLVILTTFVVIVGTVAAYTWTARPVYKAAATILVDISSSGGGSISQELPLLSDIRALTQARSVETQAEIIKSPVVLQAAYDKLSPALQELVVGAGGTVAPSAVEVKPLRNTDVISVSAYAYGPEAAAELANLICEHYVQTSQDSNRRDVRAAAQYVKGQLETVRKELEDSQRALRNYKEANKTIDLTVEAQALAGHNAQVQSELRRAESELAGARAELSAATRRELALRGETVTAESLAASPTVETLKKALVDLEQKRLETLQEYRGTSPEVRALAKQIAHVREQLQDEAKTALAQSAAPIQANVWALEAQTAALGGAAGRVQRDLLRLPEQEYQLAELTQELEVQRQTYRMLNEQYQVLRISEEGRMANARLISPAEPPSSPVRPRKRTNMALAAVLGLMLAFGLAMVVDRLDDRVHSEEEAVLATGSPVLAHLRFERDPEELVLTADTRRSSLLETFRMLRSNIMFSSPDRPIKTIVITSTQPNEGKTLIASDLAVVMALDDKRTLLVDADLRRPSIHRRMGVGNEIGLTNIAVGHNALADSLQPTDVPNLTVMTSGPLPPSPPELLNSQAWRGCMQQLREQFDFVVFDSPPLANFTDAQVLASMTDATLLVVSAREARKQVIARCRDLLAIAGAAIVGIVLNKLPRSFGPGGYYYYYYHYYDYEGGDGTKRRRSSK